MLAEIVRVLSQHRLALNTGVFRCTCDESVYTRNRRAAVEAHDIHTAGALRAAGLTIAPKDPRAAFLARQEGRTQ